MYKTESDSLQSYLNAIKAYHTATHKPCCHTHLLAFEFILRDDLKSHHQGCTTFSDL